MPYFACPPNRSRQQQTNALDPVVQLLLSQMAQNQPSSNTPPETKTPHSAPARHPSTENSPVNRDQHTFSPKFDVFETSSHYHLEGELPGLRDKKTIDIEFMSDRTLTIRGHIEQSKTPPTHTSTSSAPSAPAVTDESKESKRRSLNPTVEETEDEDNFSFVVNARAEAKKNETRSKKNEVPTEKSQAHARRTSHNVWLSERSCGNFQRSFSFPTPVDQNKVVAKLEAGLLTIQVPKVVFTGVRKIEID